MRKCKTCGEMKLEEEFRKTTGRQCRACERIRSRARKKAWARRRKRTYVDYKGGPLCAACGLVAHPSIYHFHHLDPDEKEFAISEKGYAPLEDVRDELDKCVMLCPSCHRRVHAGLIEVYGG